MNTLEIKMLPQVHGAVIYLNRPDTFNSISTELANELYEVMGELESNSDVWAVALTGKGYKSFCTGADLKERKTMDLIAMKKQRALFVKLFERVAFFSKPLIAFVNGYAFAGGFELSLCCDYIIASENAVFALSEVAIGIMPAGGGTQNLSRLIGKAKAKEIIYTAKRLSASACKELGIVSYVYSQSEMEQAIIFHIGDITKNAPLALQQAKRSINYGVDVDLHTGLSFEAECYNVLLTTKDRDEGLMAFNEKRPPDFKGC